MNNVPACRGCKHLTVDGGNAVCEAVTIEQTDWLHGTVRQVPIAINMARSPGARCGPEAACRDSGDQEPVRSKLQ
jgi:hypothetical protein